MHADYFKHILNNNMFYTIWSPVEVRQLCLAISPFFMSYVAYKTYIFIRGLYRLYLHPLSKFPGPPAACVSTAWAYGESLKGYPEHTFEVLHQQYNTKALRVGPNELHISDPELYKTIYKSSGGFPKHAAFYKSFAASQTVFTETDPLKHKERRRLLNPLFSRTGTLKLEHVVQEKLHLLDLKIQRLCHQQEIDIYNAIRLLTTEIIMQFAFSQPAGVIEEHSGTFESRFTQALTTAIHTVFYFYENPWSRRVGKFVPRHVLRFWSPAVKDVHNLLEFGGRCVKKWELQRDEKKESHPVVFDRLTSLTEAEKVTEGIDILVAGSDTTASSAATAVLQILMNPKVKARLLSSLDAAIPSAAAMPPIVELEKIEYLVACVKESLRFSLSVPGRLPRVVPSDGDPFVVDGMVVPPGTIVSMSAYTMHMNTGIWGPDARAFNPDRWLGPTSEKFEQHFTAFSKGSRMCIGQNLATAEIITFLAHFFRKYNMDLPPDFVPPRKVDVFTLEYEKPGILINMSVRD